MIEDEPKEKLFYYDINFKPTDEEHGVVARVLPGDGRPSYFIDLERLPKKEAPQDPNNNTQDETGKK